MKTIEELAGGMPESTVLRAEFPCPEVGIFTMRQAVDLVALGEELGLSPAAHNSAGDVLWDVKAQADAAPGVPRSHTADEFVWHTDASFEEPPPRYFMLQVLCGDRYGGGRQNFLPLSTLLEGLHEDDRHVLSSSLYPWRVPLEFQKDREQAELPVLFRGEDGQDNIRYRHECMTCGDLSTAQKLAILGLNRAIESAPPIEHVPRAGELILVDNWRALHARDHILDPERHLQRVRFEAQLSLA